MRLFEVVQTDLPMDRESRLQRARDMGFDTNTIYYHGTNADFEKFMPGIDPIVGYGLYFTAERGYAHAFAAMKTRTTGSGAPAVYQVFLKLGKSKVITKQSRMDTLMKMRRTGKLDRDEMFSASYEIEDVVALRDQGIDSVVNDASNEVVVFNANQVRSIYAKFDPNKADSGNLTESMDPLVVAYANEHGLGEIWWEGSGDFGEAYITEKDTILKVTNDDEELRYAKMLVGKKLDHVVDIYAVDGRIIHMEMLDTDGVEDLYYAAERYGRIEEVDVDDHPEMEPEVKKFIFDVSWGMYELANVGIRNDDLRSDNIGRKANGAYAIFDATHKEGMWG